MANLENRLDRLEKRLIDKRLHISRWFMNEDGSPAHISDYEFANGFCWIKEDRPDK